MKRAILLITLILPLFVVKSQEPIWKFFGEKMVLTPELRKELRLMPNAGVSYDFVKYKIKNNVLFSRIADISNRIFYEKSKNYGSKTSPSMQIIKIKGITYIMLDFNPFYRFEEPYYPMAQPAGFTDYKGRIYELTFFDSDTTLFTPTKEKKRVVYNRDKEDTYLLFDGPQVYL